jgi:hypothetical protein
MEFPHWVIVNDSLYFNLYCTVLTDLAKHEVEKEVKGLLFRAAMISAHGT